MLTQLDTFLNTWIADDPITGWHYKARCKRLLALAPDDRIEALAGRMLAILQRAQIMQRAA